MAYVPTGDPGSFASKSYRHFHDECGFEYPDLPAGWSDQSWWNDVAPSYGVGLLQVFIDHPDRGMRELNEPEDLRYRVVCLEWHYDPEYLHDSSPQYGEQMTYCLRTDDWDEAVRFMQEAEWGGRLKPFLEERAEVCDHAASVDPDNYETHAGEARMLRQFIERLY